MANNFTVLDAKHLHNFTFASAKTSQSRKRELMAKTVNSLLFLSQVSDLFNKCLGLCPCLYFIFPIRTTPLQDQLFFSPQGEASLWHLPLRGHPEQPPEQPPFFLSLTARIIAPAKARARTVATTTVPMLFTKKSIIL